MNTPGVEIADGEAFRVPAEQIFVNRYSAIVTFMSLIIIDAQRRDLGGFEVGRVLPQAGHRSVGPFVFFDHMGPVNFAAPIPRDRDVRPHPHVGLATITYLFAGEIVHRDSVGCTQVIRPCEVNWMTAGRGITHSERFDSMRDGGGVLHGIQAWIALPLSAEDAEPAFLHYGEQDLPRVNFPGVTVHVIAGELFGARSPVTTASPLCYAHLQFSPGGAISVPRAQPERALYVAAGSVQIGGQSLLTGQMAMLAPGDETRVVANEAATLMLLGGESVGERHVWWNFVASSRERLEAAKQRWRDGGFALPMGDDREFIPLPDR
jgi:redox-sensitive bicupin YhaK (pirin superfamily)